MAKKQINIDVGIRLKIYRHVIGMNQIEMAELFGLSQAQYFQIENGKCSFKPELMEILINKKNFNPNYLFGLSKEHTFDKKVVKLKTPDVVFMS